MRPPAEVLRPASWVIGVMHRRGRAIVWDSCCHFYCRLHAVRLYHFSFHACVEAVASLKRAGCCEGLQHLDRRQVRLVARLSGQYGIRLGMKGGILFYTMLLLVAGRSAVGVDVWRQTG